MESPTTTHTEAYGAPEPKPKQACDTRLSIARREQALSEVLVELVS